MFINPTDVISRLTSERNIARVLVSEVVKEARGLVVSPMPVGRTFGEIAIVPELRPVMAIVGAVDGPRKAAEVFDVCEATIANVKKENSSLLEEELKPVRTAAISRLSSALAGITDEKLQDVGPLNLSNIARNLSTVIGNTKKKDAEEGGNRFQFNIFAPGAGKMKEYEIMDVR